MLTSTSPSPGTGSGTSRTSSTSGPPSRSNQIAFTQEVLVQRRRQPAAVLHDERMLVPELGEERDHRLAVLPFEQQLERRLEVAGVERRLQLGVVRRLRDARLRQLGEKRLDVRLRERTDELGDDVAVPESLD